MHARESPANQTARQARCASCTPRHELDGPYDASLTLVDPIPLASLYFMYDLHQNPSVLYGLLVTENTWGTIVIDALGYRRYFGN